VPIAIPGPRSQTGDTFRALAATLSHRVVVEHPPGDIAGGKPALRDAHPKHHGCVRATFTVREDLPEHLQRGVFVPGETYEALIRFSNAFKVKHDLKLDARGMAIKLIRVKGARVALPDLSDVLPDIGGKPPAMLDEGVDTQDFLLVTHSEFFGRTAADFLRIVSAIIKTSGSMALVLTFFSLKPPRIEFRNIRALVRTMRWTSNPLFNTYFSQTPYRMGGIDTGDPEQLPAAKFCARPKQRPSLLQRLRLYPQALLSLFGYLPESRCNMLRDSLNRFLTGRDATFEFCVQMRNATDLMPLDDATVRWSTDMSPYVPVATIRIPAGEQLPVDEQLRLGQRLSFTPWHALEDHRPLGSINLARLFVYTMVSQTRSRLNDSKATIP